MDKSSRLYAQTTIDGECSRCGVWLTSITIIDAARRDGRLTSQQWIPIGIGLATMRSRQLCVACRVAPTPAVARLYALAGGVR